MVYLLSFSSLNVAYAILDSSSSRSPPLIPDMSSTSSSDDSDQPPRDHFLRTSNPTFSYTSPQSDNSKLAFLPHPHTSRAGPRPRGRSRTRDSPHRGRRERAHVDEGCLGGFWLGNFLQTSIFLLNVSSLDLWLYALLNIVQKC